MRVLLHQTSELSLTSSYFLDNVVFIILANLITLKSNLKAELCQITVLLDGTILLLFLCYGNIKGNAVFVVPELLAINEQHNLF